MEYTACPRCAKVLAGPLTHCPACEQPLGRPAAASRPAPPAATSPASSYWSGVCLGLALGLTAALLLLRFDLDSELKRGLAHGVITQTTLLVLGVTFVLSAAVVAVG